MAAGADIVGSDRVVLSVALVGESAGLVRLGAAAHDASDASVSVTSVATTDSDLPWALELVKAQCGVGSSSRQVTIVASRSARADVLALLSAPLEAEGSGGDPYHVVCRPARAFSEGAALRGLLDARILELEEGVPSSRSRAERSRLLAATIDTGDVAAMQALGGLLDYLGASNAPSSKRMARATSAAALTLSCVREFSLAQTLAMDVATAVGLGVIDALGTGSAGGQVSSLEALLSRAGSATGRRILRQWLLRPSTDVELLNKRLDAVEEAKSAMRLSAGNVTALRKALRSNVHDVVSLLRAIAGARARPAGWQQLHQSTQAMLHVGRLCVALSEQLAACSAGGSQQPPGFGGAATDDEARTGPFLASIGSTILEAEGLSRVFRLLDTVFEFDTMSRSELRDAVAEHVVPIRSGVDQTLDDLRRLQQDVPHFLESTLQTLASKHAQLSGAALEFIPQLGYLVAIDSNLDGEPTWVPDEFEHVFDASERRFFRCAESLELDETVGDVHSMLHEREQAILRSIEGHVLEHQAELCMLSEAIGELDVILALAEVAADCGYIRPTLTRDARIELRDCRHPLAEMSLRDGDEFIPNTIVLGGSDPPIILLSGPNGSGKSVLLKQLGLIVVLAQIGSFVPAREATIGIVDRLFSKIRARDTLADAHSSFTYDAARMTRMLKYSTGRSLLLVDEFGKGTASLDGAALLSAALGYLAQRGRVSVSASAPHGPEAPSKSEPLRGAVAGSSPAKLQVPRAMVVTHFREALEFGTKDATAAGGAEVLPSDSGKDQSPSTRLLHMRVVVDGDLGGGGATEPAGCHLQTVRPMFQLAAGAGEGSFGLACAAASGLPDKVVRRAANVMRMMKAGKPILPVAPHGPALAAVLRIAAGGDGLVARSSASEELRHGLPATVRACFEFQSE